MYFFIDQKYHLVLIFTFLYSLFQLIDFAAYLPGLYWLVVHHYGGNEVENTLKEWGVLPHGRKRRRAVWTVNLFHIQLLIFVM